MATFDDIARMRAALMAEKRQRMAQHPQQVAGAVGQAQGALAALAQHLQRQGQIDDQRTRAAALDKERNRHNLAMEKASLLRAQREPGKASEAKDAYRAEMTEKLRLQNEETRRERERREAIAKAQASGQIEDPAPDMPDGDEDVFVEDLETPAEKKKRIDASRAEFDLEQKQKPRGPGKPSRKPLTTAELNKLLLQQRTAASYINEARRTLAGGMAGFGAGTLAKGLSRLGSTAQGDMFSSLRATAQAVGTALEGGKLTDADFEDKYWPFFDPEKNTAEQIRRNLERFDREIRSGATALRESLGKAFDVDSFALPEVAGATAEPSPAEAALEFRTPGGKVVRLTREQYDKLSPATRKALKRVR